MLKIVDGGIISHQQGRGAYMAVITPLPDGTFIAAQHVGESLGSADNHIEVLRSADLSTWTNQGSIHAGGGMPQDGFTYRGPQIGVVPDGRLVMTATRFEMGGVLFNPDSEGLKRPEMVLHWSQDNGCHLVGTAGGARRPAARALYLEQFRSPASTDAAALDVPAGNLETGGLRGPA